MRPGSSGLGRFPLVVRFLHTIRNYTRPPSLKAACLHGDLKMLDGAKPHDVEHPTSLPDLDAPERWPDQSERNLRDANDPENWPDAGDPNDADNEEAERAANA